jgi:hypothetical protein
MIRSSIGTGLRTTTMLREQEFPRFYITPMHGRADRRALAFVAITMAASIVWIGLYAGLAAKAMGLI